MQRRSRCYRNSNAVVHNNPAVHNGWGDFQLLAKYRILSSTEANGDYILTAFLNSTFTSGTHGNGQPKSVFAPTLAYGKGWDDFEMQGTIGVTDPAAETSLIGRTYMWNHTFQLHEMSKLWPELEINRSWFTGGRVLHPASLLTESYAPR